MKKKNIKNKLVQRMKNWTEFIRFCISTYKGKQNLKAKIKSNTTP
jgi:hypothetical protein